MSYYVVSCVIMLHYVVSHCIMLDAVVLHSKKRCYIIQPDCIVLDRVFLVHCIILHGILSSCIVLYNRVSHCSLSLDVLRFAITMNFPPYCSISERFEPPFVLPFNILWFLCFCTTNSGTQLCDIQFQSILASCAPLRGIIL